MTREEAIKRIDEQYKICEEFYYLSASPEKDYPGVMSYMEALAVAITALRPVSREQVERIWPGCDYCKHAWMEGLDLKPCASGNIGVELTIGRTSKDDAFGILAYYRNAAAGYIDFPFCPFCGRPMTDEAVQIVMER